MPIPRFALHSLIISICLTLSGCLAIQEGGVVHHPPVTTEPVQSKVTEVDISAVKAAAEKLSLLDDELVVDGRISRENESVEEFDPETLADTLALLGFDQKPPGDEGVTIAATDPQYDFPVVTNDKVQYFIDYYTGNGREVFQRWLNRSGRYIPMMRDIFARAGLPRDLAYLAIVESGLNLRAYSWAHAVGPWQFISSTAKMYDLKIDWWRDERRDFVKATEAATRFLKDLHRRFDGNWYLAVAAYNAGGGRINRAVRKYGSSDFWVISRGTHLQQETRNYVPKLLAVLQIAKQPERYGFSMTDLLEPYEYTEVALPTPTDLEVVAKLCQVDYETIKDLNPELLRWSTPPNENGYLVRVPASARDRFVTAYAELPPSDRIKYLRHRIAAGDTLLKLANRHRIRVDDIVALNRIRDPRTLRIGQNLILPLKEGYDRRPLQELEDDYIRSRRRSYTVRNGDSLWKIGRRFGVSEKQLRVWNRLGWSNMIRPGQKLVVSSSGSSAKVAKRTGPKKKIIYQVKSGDTLWGIGRRFAVATGEIRSWNNLSTDHVLRPGERLTLLVRDRQRG